MVDALRVIRGLETATDPLATARAYGRAMKSLGRLIEKLPPPADAVGTLIAEMGSIFAQVVANIVPHLKGTHRRVDEQVMQGGDRSIWEPL